MTNLFNSPLSGFNGLRTPIKRNVFISYYHGDQVAVNDFVRRFAHQEQVFTPFMLNAGQTFGGDIIDSNNPTYVMSKIRERYFGQSTVTIVLVGDCTHSRRYIDWEVKASLQRGGLGGILPHGVMAIDLSQIRGSKFLPDRVRQNYAEDHSAYIPFYYYPQNGQELREWIEIAVNSRTTKSSSIVNPNDMMTRNQQCKVCGITH